MRATAESVRDPAAEAARTRPGVRRRRVRAALRRWRVPLWATGTMLPLYLVWAFDRANGGGDLAAQETWARFAAEHGGSAYGLFWFGGLHMANYSVISPYLMAAFGVRTVAVGSGLAGGWLAAVLMVRGGVRRPLGPALLAAFGLWCNVAAGRVTFALGVALGLAACVALVGESRPGIAAGHAALATTASPVAGLFLVVAGAAHGLLRHWARAAALVVPPFVVVATTTLLFPYHGQQPMPASRMVWPALLAVAVVVPAPREWRVVRGGGAVYATGVGLTYLIPSPIGTNVERLALLFAPAVLLAALLTVERRHRRRRAGLAVALVASLAWLGSGTPLTFLRGSSEVPAWAADSAGVVRALRGMGADRARVEAVPAADHREAALLSPHVQLARGWNTQLDMERGRLFYDGTFTEACYRAWLDRWAVGFVVLPSAELDRYGAEEARLVGARPEWLEPVWSDAHWRVYRVRDAVPLVSAPGSVLRTTSADLSVRMPRAGSVTVRVAWSPWLRAAGGCLREEGGFTRLTVREPGEYRIAAAYVPRTSGC